MPLQTETIDFDEEQNRIREEMQELAEEQANWEGSEDHAQRLLEQGLQLENLLNAMEWAAEEWDVDGVTFAGLTSGEINRVEDTAESHDAVRERDAWVAAGTQDAPYLAHDPGAIEQDAFEDTVGNVVDLPRPFVMWAEEKVGELSHVEVDAGNGYLAMVADEQQNDSSP